jgi:hypothetical protein
MNKMVNSQIDIQLGNISKLTQSQILDVYRQSFSHLSGMEVDQAIYDKIFRFAAFIRQQTKLILNFKAIVEKAIVYQLASSTRLARFYKQMGKLETLLAETMVADAVDEGIGEGFEYMHRSEMRVCEKYQEMVRLFSFNLKNFETQCHSLEVLDDFCREELGDCESFNEAMREIKRVQNQRSELKERLDRQFEAVGFMMDPANSSTHNSGRLKQAKADLDLIEREFRDVDMLYNIMIINMAHVEIDKYKLERQVKYAHMLCEYSQ